MNVDHVPASTVAPLAERLTPKQLAQARRALTAMAHGLDALDAQLLYGFTAEDLAALRLQLPTK
ncbi:hypothetical protein EJV47_24655 [Hymenobacter gummosus]|uniref:Uncharacterized protein n=1 Tax=Hymenobacter gummosus TaxID=1776032 RepID=A0A3S0K1H0_9BACT|nr:hypothetical protein [Hymenobacter gummosus]RTQ45679.1 hypothetical protein EJV47_24655 [Hymenobacter gummosus]